MQVKRIYQGKDGRVRAYYCDNNNIPHTKSYPRILMEEKLGRPLKPYEDVHHIDGNPLNNSLDNLEIKLHGEHQREHSQKYFDCAAICPECNCIFLWTALSQRQFQSNISRKHPRNKSKPTGPFCSKSCIGKYGKREQLRRNSQAEC